MKVLIFQLSDIHLTRDNNAILEKIDAIRGVAEAQTEQMGATLLIVSGDIAYSGNPEEYLIAIDFFSKLKELISAIKKCGEVHFVFIPGNHDCNFDDDDPTRKLVIESVLKNPNQPINASFYKTTLAVQKNYFDFLDCVQPRDWSEYANKIFYQSVIAVNGVTILANCLNTAWMSQYKEKQGELFYPELLIPVATNMDADLLITVLHHPYNWFPSENARRLRQRIESISDLVFTGHEHESEIYNKASITGTKLTHFEGGVMQDSRNPENSNFNTIVLDLDKRVYKATSYRWSTDYYIASNADREWQDFIRNPMLSRDRFMVSEEFTRLLRDPGASFTHPATANLTLEDIYVIPALKELDPEKEKSIFHRHLDPDSLTAIVTGSPGLLITGDDKCGKTSLAKFAFKQFYKLDSIPIVMNGDDFSNSSAFSITSNLKHAFTSQYKPEFPI